MPLNQGQEILVESCQERRFYDEQASNKQRVIVEWYFSQLNLFLLLLIPQYKVSSGSVQFDWEKYAARVKEIWNMFCNTENFGICDFRT